ncbi:hypothetical protein PTKIN_Ptkin05aG0213400 [Pterospermum kingtungense]
MAENLGSEETPQITVTPPSTPVSSSMAPLQLSGFLSGDTIQVEGDTGDLQFSVKFNIQNKYLPKNNSNFHCPNLNSMENNMSCQNSSFSSYMTPKSTTPEIENHGVENDQSTGKTETRTIMTRLRSGAVSQVKYFPRMRRKEGKDLMSCRTRKRKKRERGDIVLEKLLQRRSCPVRPCSSYVFFVMACWGSVKLSSFSEASKRLSQMWCKLSPEDKKVYEDIALKDSARYKRQCMLLNCNGQDLSANRIDEHSTN